MPHEHRGPTGSHRWPSAAWWAPLLFDLAGLQRANTGLLLRVVDLVGSRPRITVSRHGRPEVRFDCTPEPGPGVLLSALRESGPADPAPFDHGTVFWDPGTVAGTAERHAFLLDELASWSGAWSTRADEPFDLLGVTVHADHSVTDLRVRRPRRGDVVVLRLPVLAPVDMIGLTYGLVEHLWDLDVEALPEIGPIAGLSAHLVHMR